MASSAAQSKKQFKRSMTKKSHSWWWDSYNCPKNSKWLTENLEKMDDRVNHMLKLIEEDADSFAKKAQMYFQKRPELLQLVEEFYRMYRALAERYDQASGELQKNHHSSKIQSQSSLEISSPSPTQEKLSRRQSGHKEEEDSSSLTDSGSDSDHSSADEALIRRMADLEVELEETKQKLLLQQESDLLHKITVYEGELGKANEKIRMHEEVIANLKIELQSCMSSGIEDPQKSLDLDKEDTKELSIAKVQALEEELSIAKEKVQHFEKETYSLRTEVEISKAAEEKLKSLQNELELAQKDTDGYRNTLNAEKKEVSKLQERLAMVKTSLQDRDNEIRALKTAVSDAEEKIFPEKAQIKGEMSKLLEERSRLGEQLRELESHIRLITEEKAETEEKLRGESKKISVMRDESNVLRKEIGKREEMIKEMEKHMEELHMEQVRLRRRSSELTEEVERTRLGASEVAEQKREAIRQLCISLEHYRDGYDRLWRVVAGHKSKRVVVLAT
ncbi:PREDICTED: protein NETWORKED 4B-like [Camelina sativa]|uniref:Protein NETWORKED 4B-like n=1 Tax=Camelina sativa TaxID=90675 RepID=A0ABM0Z4L3_CAMSA|nr:PREDICTED: protein NETWORKED 4B-like [Camelina sativa]